MEYLDRGSIVVAATTLVLFVGALVTKGFTHDLLLEAGVFLVSVKLFMMVHKNGVTEERINAKLDSIIEHLKGTYPKA